MARWGELKLQDGRRLLVDMGSVFDDGHLDEAEIDQACKKLCAEAEKAGVTREQLESSRFQVVEVNWLRSAIEIQPGRGRELLLRAHPPQWLREGKIVFNFS